MGPLSRPHGDRRADRRAWKYGRRGARNVDFTDACRAERTRAHPTPGRSAAEGRVAAKAGGFPVASVRDVARHRACPFGRGAVCEVVEPECPLAESQVNPAHRPVEQRERGRYRSGTFDVGSGGRAIVGPCGRLALDHRRDDGEGTGQDQRKCAHGTRIAGEVGLDPRRQRLNRPSSRPQDVARSVGRAWCDLGWGRGTISGWLKPGTGRSAIDLSYS